MKIGAHMSTAGGVDTAIDRAVEMGAEAVQIFASSPRAWAFKPLKEDTVIAFREKSERTGVAPTFLHASYLVNVGGSQELLEKSINSLVDHLGAASQIGAAGVIFHGGSHKGVGFDGVLPQATDALRQVLDRTPDDVWLIIENAAGMGNHIGASFKEIGRLMDAVDSPRMMTCLDHSARLRGRVRHRPRRGNRCRYGRARQGDRPVAVGCGACQRQQDGAERGRRPAREHRRRHDGHRGV